VLHVARWKCRTQKIAKKSPSGHHSTTLSGYIFAIKAYIDNRKNMLNSNTSSTCPHNMVNFRLLTAEIRSGVWAPQVISTGFASWQRYCTASSSGRQPNFAALNRRRHLYSAGRPSPWALGHILVMAALCNRGPLYFCPVVSFYLLLSSFFFSSPNLTGRRLDVYHTSTHGVALVRI